MKAQAALGVQVAAVSAAVAWDRRDPALRRAEALLADPGLMLLPNLYDRLVLVHARALEESGRFGTAIAQLQKLTERTIPSENLWTPAAAALVRCYRRDGAPATAIAVARDALRACGAAAGEQVAVRAELLCAHAALGDHAMASQILDDVLARAMTSAPPEIKYVTFSAAAYAAAQADDLTETRRWAGRAYAVASQHHLAPAHRLATQYANLLLQAEDGTGHADATAALVRLVPQAEVEPALSTARWVLSVRAHLAKGDVARALRTCDALLAAAANAPSSVTGHALAEVGKVLVANGEVDAGITALRDGAQLLEAFGLLRPAAHAWAEAAVWSAATNDTATASRTAERAWSLIPVVPYTAPAPARPNTSVSHRQRL
ncbi:hypothetical protein [Actinoallomurus acanthiterrae]